MKLKQFTYTKSNGEVSQRSLVELVAPSTFVEGLDVTDMAEDAFNNFAIRMAEIENAQYIARVNLYNEFSLGKAYRRFTPENMTDVTVTRF